MRQPSRHIGAGLLALLACAWALIAAGPAPAAESAASLTDIEDEVMCPICGTLLELSDSPQANRERALIRRLIAEGRDKDEIKDVLVSEYGNEVLATPSSSGFDLSAWIVPALGIGAAVGALAVALLQRRRRRTASDRTAPEIAPADAARLDRDMTDYDL
jgi:cytochrome c-type biogenesis protein CcmH